MWWHNLETLLFKWANSHTEREKNVLFALLKKLLSIVFRFILCFLFLKRGFRKCWTNIYAWIGWRIKCKKFEYYKKEKNWISWSLFVQSSFWKIAVIFKRNFYQWNLYNFAMSKFFVQNCCLGHWICKWCEKMKFCEFFSTFPRII